VTERGEGAFALVLHTHMPYVEGYGTWPFGEEWLWEAIATCYLPLLEILDAGTPVTLSVTPVLLDQLEAPGLDARLTQFIDEIRAETHRRDRAGLLAAGEQGLADEIARSGDEYRQAREALARRGGLAGAFAPHAAWTSSATHAVLPLVACDVLSALQIEAGVAARRERSGAWRGGFWLPECAHAPWIEPLLAGAGVQATCVELTARFGLGAAEHLQPLRSVHGPLLVPIDRATVDLVWGAAGYPADGAYRDYHRLTTHHHRPWDNAGRAYDRDRAAERVAEHAADFVERVQQRISGGGLLVCALDTELLGHWWFEGPAWLAAVLAECERRGVPLTALDDALEGIDAPLTDTSGWAPSSWGAGGDLSTWSTGPASAMARAIRRAELDYLAAGSPRGAARRELLALQASDWCFVVARGTATPYGHERHDAHLAQLRRALAGEPVPGPRSLALRAG
jgi:1,4-alpha-glucan branching enzyme